jgi:uncharacterized protein
MLAPRVNAYLVVGGRYHDMDFARLELLKLLGEHACIRTRVGEDYRDIEAILAADVLVTYTVDVVPDEATAARLRDWVAPDTAGSRCTARTRSSSGPRRTKPGRRRGMRRSSWKRSAASSSPTRRSRPTASR